ncbi:roundabout homolog 1-like [Stylophora pistillata]|uniref:roundabout homolog 1-like n=1 Tax=Stylophora pistillata TaxID=50429 RepID=UPI000C043723|nr:roundabout homolog 1-like [Stylophora pistillata]
MMTPDSSLGEVAKCTLLLTLTGVLWSLSLVRGETCNSNLRIRPVVDISSSPENKKLHIGASITLTCTAEPRKIDSGYLDRWVDYIEWYDPQGRHVGAKCLQPSNIHAHKLKLSCPLVLKNLTVENFGSYTCQAGNGYVKHCTRSSFEIRIPDVHIPEILEGPKNQSVLIGSNVTFSCTAKGLPRPTIHWIKVNTSRFLRTNPRGRVIQDGRTNRSQLLIIGVEMEDYGKYLCIANNSFGRTQSGVVVLNIDVQKPEIVEGPKNQRASIGSNATFSCTVKGLPRPTIYWIKDNASYPLQSNPRTSLVQEGNDIRSLFLITGVQTEDYGIYQCIAKNSVGRKESGVVFLSPRNLEKPEIVEHPKNQTYSIGSDLVFSCTATGLPQPNITWIKNNDPNVTKTNPRLRTILDLDDTKSHSVLLITEATKEDAGTYQCFVNNSAGERTSNVASLHIKEGELLKSREQLAFFPEKKFIEVIKIEMQTV